GIPANGSPPVKWDGVQWTALPSLPSPRLFALAVFDEDGAGPGLPKLFAGMGESYTLGLYRLDGSSWSAVGGGLTTRSASHVCGALLVVDEDGPGPGGPTLLVG